MAGRLGRSGGWNRLSPEDHALRGTRARHRHPVAELAVSQADRRRAVAELDGTARRVVAQLLGSHDGWDAASLTTLRAYGLSCARMERLQTATEASPTLAREVRINLSLLRELNLEQP